MLTGDRIFSLVQIPQAVHTESVSPGAFIPSLSAGPETSRTIHGEEMGRKTKEGSTETVDTEAVLLRDCIPRLSLAPSNGHGTGVSK